MLFYWLGGKASLLTRFDAILLVGWRDIISCKALCERIFNKGGEIEGGLYLPRQKSENNLILYNCANF
ncbi:hypothetical protein H5410_040970 [Solanum commersonii]|uniref:Uncharacterized protein n=1 Tax=Solanum commersonii TaxID=4109 RepID=A0A9J5XTG9_SOLCO|nr:hypothetical protein H5410_040970 [Solanum commersonii]